MTWYALLYKHRQGDRAAQHLQNQGVSIFFPKIMVEKVTAGRRTKSLEPLFPGYLFINIEQTDPRWAKLRSTRGVVRVVSFAHKPAVISEDVICQIKQGLAYAEQQGGITSGQSLRLESGPFRGFEAVFQCYKGEDRALVLISFLQKSHSLAVPLSAISC